MGRIVGIAGRAIDVELGATRVRGSAGDLLGREAGSRTEFQDVVQRRLPNFPQRADVDEGRWPKPYALQARRDRELELEPAHVIGSSAQSVGDPRLTEIEVSRRVVRDALDARADSTNVEAAKLGSEKAVGETDRLDLVAVLVVTRLE